MATAKSETLKTTIINAVTGEQIVREFNAEELAQRELEIVEATAQQSAIEAKATARASALAKLAELGLTQEEIAAL
jgi:DNA-binding NarL/FixJ family response regulator